MISPDQVHAILSIMRFGSLLLALNCAAHIAVYAIHTM